MIKYQNIASFIKPSFISNKITPNLKYSNLLLQKEKQPIMNSKNLTKPLCYFNSIEKIKKKFDAYWRLCRNHQPIGSMLLYWPTAWGVCIGSQGFPSLFYLSLFLMGSYTARSAGCIVNDYLDKDFDKKVQRTKLRPLASGEVSTNEAGALLFLNLCGGLVVLFNMPLKAIITAFAFVGLGGIYPLAKRYTNYPQFVLGMAFNSGIIIGSFAVNPNIFPNVILPMYISGIAWTLVYDTIYAYQDLKDDLKIGVKSTAVTWKDKNPKLIMQRLIYLMTICHLSLPLLDSDYGIAIPFMLVADFKLIQQLRKLSLDNRKDCGEFFLKNNIYGFVIFCALAIVGIAKSFSKSLDDQAETKQ